MPSYQDYVVARDDHDPNSAGGAGTGSGTAASSRGGETDGESGDTKSRVVRMRTFLVGNLDRGQMNNNRGSGGGTSSSVVSDVVSQTGLCSE